MAYPDRHRGSHGNRRLSCWFMSLMISALCACTDPTELVLQPIPNQSAQVGVELTVDIVVLNTTGSTPNFSLTSQTIPDLQDRAARPRFIPFGGGGAYLRWVPLAQDVGEHVLTVQATLDGHSTSVDFTVSIRPGSAKPTFIRPLGSGKTMDLIDGGSCISFQVQVQDADTTRVELDLAPPIEAGFEFEQTGDQSGEFNWCPNAGQLERANQYTVNLVANDGDGHVERKTFTILIRRPVGTNCPGRVPVVEFSPETVRQMGATIVLSLQGSDDIGIEPAPIVYYSFQQPNSSVTRDISALKFEEMERDSGSALNGVYSARVTIPSDEPIDGFHYFIEVTDNDDVTGTCDHRISEPVNGYHRFTVVPPEQSAPVAPCTICQTDEDCGSGRCVDLGGGQWSCLNTCAGPSSPQPVETGCSGVPAAGCCQQQNLLVCLGGQLQETDCGSPFSCGWDPSINGYSCRTDGDIDPSGRFPRECQGAASTPTGSAGCSDGFSCSSNQYSTAGGDFTQVCVPNSGTCEQRCDDDIYEDNDHPNAVTAPVNTNETITGLQLCSEGRSVDDDYYGVFIDDSKQINASILFSHAEQGDVDMALLDDLGNVIDRGYSITDNETVSACLVPGFYFVHVLSYTTNINASYDLLVEVSEQTCCIDDALEDDDGPNQAHDVDALAEFGRRQICPGDQDWYRIELRSGQTLTVEVLFDHGELGQDIDVFIADLDGQTNLSRALPPPNNGLSVTDNERLVFTAARDGLHYVVVKGFQEEDSNDYVISFSLSDNNEESGSR